VLDTDPCTVAKPPDDSTRLEAALEIVLGKLRSASNDALLLRAKISSLVRIWGRLRPDLTAEELAATVIRINQLLP
jgi:hypothetical protein